MSRVDYSTMSLSRWVQYWLLQGRHEEDVRADFERRFPDLPITRYMTALKYAQRAMRIGERVRQLAPDQPLSAALGRGHPPDPSVSLRFLATWKDAAGHVYHNWIVVLAQWAWTWGDVIARAGQLLSRITSRYEGVSDVSLDLSPAVLFPSGEQL